MEKDVIQNVIHSMTESAGKDYEFNNEHNPFLPADHWFQMPSEGFTLFLVLYSRACRWSKCLGCNLPSKVSDVEISFSDIMKQIDYVFDYLLDDEKKKSLKKIILSNNGSVLDEATFSTTALIYFIAKMNINCPNISVLTLETRPEYVDWEEMEVISRALKEGQTETDLEIAIGFEAFDDTIRNDYFFKGLPLDTFEDMVKKVAKYGFSLKTYFMQKPVPYLSEDEAIEDIKDAIDYLDKVSRKNKISINMHLNPTYVARGTKLAEEFEAGRYTPPLLENVRKAVLHASGKDISIYIGLNDEGLAVEGGSFIRPEDNEIVAKMEEFNRTGDYKFLK